MTQEGDADRVIQTDSYHSLEARLLMDKFAQRNEDALKGYNQFLVSQFPNIRDYETRVSFGVFSWTVHQEKYKLLREQNAISLGGGANYCSPSQLARFYLDEVYSDRRKKAHRAQIKSISEWRPMPLFINPQVFADGVYIDTVSAWFSILNLVGWDVDYDPARWLIGGRPPFDFPLPNEKIARNCIVTSSLPTPKTEWTGSRFREVHIQNKFVNLGLWSLISDILHALSFEALECKATYVHTDGYIVPRNRANELVERIAEYGLKARVKYEGPTVVMGFSNWMVGKHKAANWGAYTSNSFSNLRYVDRAWLKTRLKASRNSMVVKWGIP